MSAQLRSSDTPAPLPQGECPVCLRDDKSCDMLGLSCGHKFCRDCWLEYILSKLAVGVASCKHTYTHTYPGDCELYVCVYVCSYRVSPLPGTNGVGDDPVLIRSTC